MRHLSIKLHGLEANYTLAISIRRKTRSMRTVNSVMLSHVEKPRPTDTPVLAGDDEGWLNPQNRQLPNIGTYKSEYLAVLLV
jgi:hypothetical protein